MARQSVAPKGGKARGPSPRELAMREEAFRVYRDMGPTRSYARLQVALRTKFGEIAGRTFSNWAKAHSWKSRLEEFDATHAQAAQLPVGQKLDPDFDKIETLLTAAHLALTRALSSVPVVTKPQDFKALVDAARNAIDLTEKLQQLHGRGGQKDEASSRKSMFALLNQIEDRIRKAAGAPRQGEVIDVTAEDVGSAEDSVVEAAGDEVGAPQPESCGGEEEEPAQVDQLGSEDGGGGDSGEAVESDVSRPMTMAERLAARRSQKVA